MFLCSITFLFVFSLFVEGVNSTNFNFQLSVRVISDLGGRYPKGSLIIVVVAVLRTRSKLTMTILFTVKMQNVPVI